MMDENTKKYALLILASLAACVVLATQCVNGNPVPSPSSVPGPISSQSPTPVISATPSPTVSPSPIPSPSPSPSSSPIPAPSVVVTPSPSPIILPLITLKGVVGETVSTVIVATSASAVPSGLSAFEIQTVKTLIPSFKGAAIGAHEDPLKPVTSLEAGKKYWVETKLSISGTRDYGLLTTVTKPGPMKTMPFYAEMQSANAMLAQGYPADSNVSIQCPNANRYSSLLRSHGVEPIKQYAVYQNPPLANGKLDLDGYFPTYGCDFRTTVLKGAIAPPMIISWKPSVSAAVLAAIKATLPELPVDSWAYAWDEGQSDPSLNAQALAQAKAYRASGLKIMETRTPTDEFAPYVDWSCPVLNFSPYSAAIQCAYASCMSQGNCQPQTLASVQPPTGDPMMVLDAPAVHARAFAWVLDKVGAPRGLYFNSTQKVITAWADGGQYNEGGNGDGTLVYPGKDGNPWPSLRLKRLYRGLQDVWYIGKGAINPVTSSKVWPKDESAYESARLAAWDAL